MLPKFISLWEIPDGSLGLIIVAASENPAPRVFILELFGPLPHVSN
jgi:hypothetical protein